MATFQDLPVPLQDRINMEAARLIMLEDEHKAYLARCAALRRQPFVYCIERPSAFGHSHFELGEPPIHPTEVRHKAKYQQRKQLEARMQEAPQPNCSRSAAVARDMPTSR